MTCISCKHWDYVGYANGTGIKQECQFLNGEAEGASDLVESEAYGGRGFMATSANFGCNAWEQRG